MILKKNNNSLSSDVILNLRSKGMNDHQIIDYLKEQGYNSIDIFEALTDADAKDGKIVSENESNSNIHNNLNPSLQNNINDLNNTNNINNGTF